MGLFNRQKVQIDRDFTTYDAPFRSANILDYYGPQAVTVVEERGTWLRIRTYAGYQWLDTKKKRSIYLKCSLLMIVQVLYLVYQESMHHRQSKFMVKERVVDSNSN